MPGKIYTKIQIERIVKMKQNNTLNPPQDNKKRLKEILEILMANESTKVLTPEKLKLLLQDLGPCFVRLGQIMASRQDILPKDFRDELKTLESSVDPMDYDELKQIMEQEYGLPIDEIFSEIDETPISLSSISQSHKATLKDGPQVIIKVQRPGVSEIISQDVSLLKKALNVLRLESSTESPIDLNIVLDELWTIAEQEMNYLLEAKNTERFYDLNANISSVISPKIDQKYTTSHILVMEYIDGIEIIDTEQLESLGYNLKDLAETLANNYVKQFMEDGFFHADPSPKNILAKNGRIVWLNFSLMGNLSLSERELLTKAIEAIQKHDLVELKNVLVSIGINDGKVSNSKLYASLDNMVAKYDGADMQSLDLSKIIKEFVVLLNENEISLPEGFSMLCLGLIAIDHLLKQLDPTFNMVSLFYQAPLKEETNASQVSAGETYSKETTPATVSASPSPVVQPPVQVVQPPTSFEPTDKTVDMIAQISDILKMAVEGQTKLNLKLTVSEDSLSSVDKIMNKLIICLISVSLLIGACSIFTTNMNPKIWGIPILGVVLFVISIILIAWLTIRIIRKK